MTSGGEGQFSRFLPTVVEPFSVREGERLQKPLLSHVHGIRDDDVLSCTGCLTVPVSSE